LNNQPSLNHRAQNKHRAQKEKRTINVIITIDSLYGRVPATLTTCCARKSHASGVHIVWSAGVVKQTHYHHHRQHHRHHH